MGLLLSAAEDKPFGQPRRLVLRLGCDRKHGLLRRPIVELDATDGDLRTVAANAGWKITADGDVLCPRCR